MITNEMKDTVRRLLAEHIGNPSKTAARERCNIALTRLIALGDEAGLDAEREFADSDAEFRRVMGWSPRPHRHIEVEPDEMAGFHAIVTDATDTALWITDSYQTAEQAEYAARRWIRHNP